MSETTSLPTSARALLASAGLDLERFDIETERAETEAPNSNEGGAA